MVFRNKEWPNDELFLLILSVGQHPSYPLDNPLCFWKDDLEECETKEILFPESTFSSILNADNNCLSSLGLHSSPLDPEKLMREINKLVNLSNIKSKNRHIKLHDVVIHSLPVYIKHNRLLIAPDEKSGR